MLSGQKRALEERVIELLKEKKSATAHSSRQEREWKAKLDAASEEAVKLRDLLNNLHTNEAELIALRPRCLQLQAELTEAHANLASVLQNQDRDSTSLEAAQHQIAGLRADLNSRISTAKQAFSALQEELQAERASSSDFQIQLQAANSRIANLENHVPKEKARKKMRQEDDDDEDRDREPIVMSTDLKDECDHYKQLYEASQMTIFSIEKDNRDLRTIEQQKQQSAKESKNAQDENKALRHDAADLRNRLEKLVQVLHARDAEIAQLKAGGPPTEKQKRLARKEQADHLEQLRRAVIENAKK